jgi:SAM-dependent methyltransferase
MIDSYLISAKYYDGAYSAMNDLVDIPFYLDLAKRIAGHVLEIGCGTGRILLPIARAGIEVHGVDNSGPMLSVLKERLSREMLTVRERVSLQAGDMRDFRVNRKFPCSRFPFDQCNICTRSRIRFGR